MPGQVTRTGLVPGPWVAMLPARAASTRRLDLSRSSCSSLCALSTVSAAESWAFLLLALTSWAGQPLSGQQAGKSLHGLLGCSLGHHRVAHLHRVRKQTGSPEAAQRVASGSRIEAAGAAQL